MMNEYYLQISGVVSKSSYKFISNGFTKPYNESLVLNLFCSYSEYEVPIGSEFNYLVNLQDNRVLKVKAILIDVTQAYGLSYNSVPLGHKTISRFEFSESDISLIKNEIPVADTWFSSNSKFELRQKI